MNRQTAGAKRNEIIRRLRRGDKYSDIAKAVHTSTNTITKIAREIELPRRKRVAVNAPKSRQPCWTCARATGFCSWSHAHRPVKGWTAEKVSVDGRETYRITACPLYVDERSDKR